MKLLRAFLLTVALSLICSLAQAEPKRILVVTATEGFPHSSVMTAEHVLTKLGVTSKAYTVVGVIRSGPRPKDKAEETAWLQKMTNDFAELMSPKALNDYDGVIFANTTGELPIPDKDAFINWVKAGHAFIGMHAATDTFHNYRPYIEMIGGEFASHAPGFYKATAINQDLRHPATRRLGQIYEVTDELYRLTSFHRDQVHGLLTMDHYPSDNTPGDYPIAWCKKFGKGNVIYTSLGHREEVWESAIYQEHVLGAIRWALGLDAGDATPQKTAYVVSQAEKIDGFKPLFNGVDMKNWAARNADAKNPWHAENGMLVNHANEPANDVVTEKPYKDFILRFEFMVGNGTPSVLVHGNRDVLEKVATGAPGTWQPVEIRLITNSLTIAVNNAVVYDKVDVGSIGSDNSQAPTDETGPIVLPGKHGAVAYRNVRIRELSPFDIRTMNSQNDFSFKAAKSGKKSKKGH